MLDADTYEDVVDVALDEPAVQKSRYEYVLHRGYYGLRSEDWIDRIEPLP